MSVMNADHKLTETLSILGAEPARDVSDDFMTPFGRRPDSFKTDVISVIEQHCSLHCL